MFWEILIIIVLVLLNAFFAMSEMAIVSVRRARLQPFTEGRNGDRARLALELSENPSRILSTVQVGITLIGIFAGAYGGATLAERVGAALDTVPWIAPYGHQLGFAIVVALITYLSLIVGELVPKRLALAHAERIAMAVAHPMNRLARIAGPLVWLFAVSTETVLKLLRLSGSRDQGVTEDEVKTLLAEGAESGVFEPAERHMIESVLRLTDRVVRSIMTPRPDIMWIDIDDPRETVIREIRQSGYSRFLVCRGDVDEVVGIAASKAMLDRALNGEEFDLRAVLTDPLIVHDGTPVMRLLELFKQASVHMAVVVDEYGSVEGIVTITDIIESIAGELPEHGLDDDAGIVRREDGSWLVDGMTPIEDVETALDMQDLRDDDRDYHTLAGFMLDHLGHVPAVSEAVEWRGLRFEVVDMDGRRIDKVLVQEIGGIRDEAE
jgi:putative hemolysin